MRISPPRSRGGRASAAALGLGAAGAFISVYAVASGPSLASASTGSLLLAPTTSDPRAISLLTDASYAARATGYSGTQYVSSWGPGTAATIIVQVSHLPGSGTLLEVQPSAAGPGGTMFEPETSELPVSVGPLAVASADDAPLALLRRNFQISLGGAHGDSQEVVARRPDNTVAARFWIQHETRLAVRRELYDDDGALVRATAYVELTVGTPNLPATAKASGIAAEERLAAPAVNALREKGWVVPPQLPDGMVLVDVRRQTSSAATVLHLGYTDGLSTISVFVQQGRLRAKDFTHWAKETMGGRVYVHDDGLTRHIAWSGHGRVYTVVADAAPGALRELVAQLPHGEKHRGLWGRLKHGMARLGSWLDPFN